VVSKTAWRNVIVVLPPLSAKVMVTKVSGPGRPFSAVPGEGEDQALGHDDLAIDAALPELLTGRVPAEAKAPAAADAPDRSRCASP